jgi:hypothetical protein
MQKRKLYWLCGLTIAFIAVALATLCALVKHEPSFYTQAHMPPGEERKALANKFLTEFGQMVMDMKSEQWRCELSEAELNSFFDDQFMKLGEGESLRKVGISDPRINLGDDSVRLAFRYGSGWFSTVISYDLKVWLVPKEPNVIAVEVVSARAGGLPISSRTILQQLSDYAQTQNYKVTLYRKETNAVAVIELQQGQQPSSKMLTRLDVKSGKLAIHGRTMEHALALPMIKAP